MTSCWGKVLFTISVLILACSDISLANNAIEPGALMYKAGHLEQAKQYFQSEIASAPTNAYAHYMLANVLVELKLYADAKKEYEIAQELDPSGPTGKYSRSALVRLGAPETFQSKNSSSQSSMSSKNVNNNQTIKGSVRSISRQTGEEEQRAEAECDTKVKQIYKEADDRVQKLEAEMRDKISDNGEAQYTSWRSWHGIIRTTKTYDPALANDAVRQEYQGKIDQIRSEASLNADKVKAAYKSKEGALEDSALTLDKSYITDKKADDVSLAPSGTNMYVRNYQIKQNPSGNTVPVKAAPPKSLSDIKSSKVPSH